MADEVAQAETPTQVLRDELRAAAGAVVEQVTGAVLDLLGQLKAQSAENHRQGVESQEAYRRSSAAHEETARALAEMSTGIARFAETMKEQAAESRVLHAESLKEVHLALLRIEAKIDRVLEVLAPSSRLGAS